MGIEGGGRFERRPDMGRGLEGDARGREVFPRRTPEVSGGTSWIERFITPKRLAEVAASPYGENRSPESLLVERLTGVLVEEAPEWDPQARTNLRNFVNALRIAAYPNMRPHEQRLIRDIAESLPGGWAAQTIDPDEVGADIRLTWQRFGFIVPQVQPGEIGSEFARFYAQPTLEADTPQAAVVQVTSEIPSRVVPAVQVVLTREGKNGTEVFLGHRIAGGFLNQWSFPGGRIDEGESHQEAGIRELREETGVDIAEDRLTHLRDTQSSTVREKGGKKVRYDYKMRVFTVDAQDLDPQNASPDEHSEMSWMPLDTALAMHNTAVEQASGETPDKIPGALAPRTLETIQFLSQKS